MLAAAIPPSISLLLCRYTVSRETGNHAIRSRRRIPSVASRRHRLLNLAYCSAVSIRNTPPLPTLTPCSIAWRHSRLRSAPACSASCRILSDVANVNVRGSGVLRSSSRNWQYQPLREKKDIYTRRRGAHRSQYRSPVGWVGSGFRDTLQTQQILPVKRIRDVDARSPPIGE